MQRSQLRHVALLFLLITSGCVMSTGYPSSWADLSSGLASCELLDGTYSNLGQGAKTSFYPVRLANALYFREAEAIKADGIRINLHTGNKDHALMGVTKVDGKTVYVPSGTAVNFSCVGGVASWSGSVRDLRNDNVGDPLVGVESMSIEIRRGKDKALYLRRHESGGGLVYMFLPIAYSDLSWQRFEVVEE